MQYKGLLYGRVAGRFLPLEVTGEGVDRAVDSVRKSLEVIRVARGFGSQIPSQGHGIEAALAEALGNLTGEWPVTGPALLVTENSLLREEAWNRVRARRPGVYWSDGEVVTYRGFFHLGWDAARGIEQ